MGLNIKKKIVFFFLLVVLSILLAGCNSENTYTSCENKCIDLNRDNYEDKCSGGNKGSIIPRVCFPSDVLKEHCFNECK